MKLTFDVNLEDVWSEEDETLDEALKVYIKDSVLREVTDKLKEQALKALTAEIKKAMDLTVSSVIESTVKDSVRKASEEGLIVYNGKEVLIKDHAKEMFTRESSWNRNNALDCIKEMAKKFAEEMKARYDLAFASQVVATMNENGLLKEDVLKTLAKKD